MYLRLAIFGYCHAVHDENLQVAPADFLTYGYGSCTAKISGDTANSGRRHDARSQDGLWMLMV